MPRTHQQRLLAALGSNLENHEPPLELTWDQTVASNVGYIGSVWPGEVTALRRLYVNFQADYATFKPVTGSQIHDKGTIHVNFGQPNAESKFKQVLEYLCVR